METIKSNMRMLNGVAAATMLVAAGLSPAIAAPAISTSAVVDLSADIALVSNAVVGGIDGVVDLAAFDLPGTAEAFDIDAFDVPGTAEAFDITAFDVPGSAAVFDIAGLLNAEWAAIQSLFYAVFSLPGSVIYHFESMIDNLFSLDFGMAFSDLASIPQDIVNYLIGVPIAVGNILYEMVAVIPGEFLLNFG